MVLVHGELTQRILSCAFEVHRGLGPGLLESAYRACLMHELGLREVAAKTEVPVVLQYRGTAMTTGYRADIVVEDTILLELKAVERLLPIHEAQALTYLRLSTFSVGLLINFNVVSLKNGIKRLVGPAARNARGVPSTP